MTADRVPPRSTPDRPLGAAAEHAVERMPATDAADPIDHPEQLEYRATAENAARAATSGAVEIVNASELHAIRTTVLRDGTPSDDVHFPGDDDAAAVHTAIRDHSGTIVAAASWFGVASPDAPGEPALQLRGMAVAAGARRPGLGERLVAAGAALAAERGVAVLWANARDTALDFYRAAGFTVVGDGFVTSDTVLPHHRIVRRLD